MPLDPQARARLDERFALGKPPLHRMTPAAARADIEASIDRISPREEVNAVEDRQIAGPHGPIPVRIYTPQGSRAAESGPLPILVYFHGGGWVVCSIETHDAWCRHLV